MRLGLSMASTLLLANFAHAKAPEEHPDAFAKKTLLGVHFQQEFLMVSGAEICSRVSRQTRNVTCVDSDTGVLYDGDPLPGAAGQVDRRFVPGSGRLVLGFERLLARRVGLGGRLGYAISGGPTSSTGERYWPFSAEARLSYWPVSPGTSWFLPFATAIAGVAQGEAKVEVRVLEAPTAEQQAAGVTQVERTLDVWKRAGYGFGGLSLGFMLGLVRDSGPILELRFLSFFPTSAVSVAPEFGYAVRF